MIRITYRHSQKTRMLFIDNLVRFLRSYPYVAIDMLSGLRNYMNEVRPKLAIVAPLCLVLLILQVLGRRTAYSFGLR